jgi:hypothetical protein
MVSLQSEHLDTLIATVLVSPSSLIHRPPQNIEWPDSRLICTLKLQFYISKPTDSGMSTLMELLDSETKQAFAVCTL